MFKIFPTVILVHSKMTVIVNRVIGEEANLCHLDPSMSGNNTECKLNYTGLCGFSLKNVSVRYWAKLLFPIPFLVACYVSPFDGYYCKCYFLIFLYSRLNCSLFSRVFNEFVFLYHCSLLSVMLSKNAVSDSEFNVQNRLFKTTTPVVC